MKKTHQFLSVILTTWNRKNDLRECLDSLLVQDYPRNRYEIIVVCDPSTDGSEDLLLNEYRMQVKAIINPHKTTLPQTRNKGLRVAKGQLIILCSDDLVYYDRQMFRKFAQSFNEHPDIGMIGGRWERIGNEVICKYSALYEELNYPVESNNSAEYYVGAEELKRVNGAEVLAIPRRVFDHVGKYNEAFTWGGEDSDLRQRILKAGYKLKYDLRLTAKHKMRGTIRAFARREFRLGEASAQWNQHHPELTSTKHKLGIALAILFSATLVYGILASLLKGPYPNLSFAGTGLLILGATGFFSIDALRYALFYPIAPLRDRVLFLELRLIQNFATYTGLVKKTFLG